MWHVYERVFSLFACIDFVNALNIKVLNLLFVSQLDTHLKHYISKEKNRTFLLRENQKLTNSRHSNGDVCLEWSPSFSLVCRKKPWKEQTTTGHDNNQLLIQSDTSLNQCLSCRSGLDCTSLLSKSLTCYWLWFTFEKNPAEMTLCSGGVTLEDNILQKHSLKADLREKIWLLHFLSVVARLILWHTLCLAASKSSLAVCKRRGGQQRKKKKKKISHSGWHARTSNVPGTPYTPLLTMAFPLCAWWLDPLAPLSHSDLNPSLLNL